jgi:peroxiredoxin
MSIAVGTDMLSSVIRLQPAHPWYQSSDEGSNKASDNEVKLRDLFEGKTVAFFGVPAPFTGTCTLEHYPAYKALAKDFKKAGCDEIVCYTVSDPYAHHAWQVSMENNEKDIKFLADPDGSFARAYGLDRDYGNDCSLGKRSERFSMIVSNGIVANFRIVENASTDAGELLSELKELMENVAA